MVLVLVRRALKRRDSGFPVTRGERLVAITFIQSRIQDPFRRNLLFELNEVAALEGLKMDQENYGRLQLIQQNLLRYWSDKP